MPLRIGNVGISLLFLEVHLGLLRTFLQFTTLWKYFTMSRFKCSFRPFALLILSLNRLDSEGV